MLSQYDPWFAIDPPVDETTDLLTIPEIRRELAHAAPGEEVGLRSLLEHPEVLSKGLWSQGLERHRRDVRGHHRRNAHRFRRAA
jgi:hypothetical protein